MKKHTYFHTCPWCGAALDPGERCDCRDPPGDHPGRWPESKYTPTKKERTNDDEKPEC